MAAIPRTAVVLVHGIGEQRPLDTLFGFLGTGNEEQGVLESDAQKRWFINADSISDLTYERRITVNTTHRLPSNIKVDAAENRSWQRFVDVYEYYWAYHFRDTAWGHLSSWLSDLLKTNRGGVTSKALVGARRHRAPLIAVAVAAWIGVMLAAISLRNDRRIPFSLTARWSAFDQKPWIAYVVGAFLCLVFLAIYFSSLNLLGLITFAKGIVWLIILMSLAFVAWTIELDKVTTVQGWIAAATLAVLIFIVLGHLFAWPLNRWTPPPRWLWLTLAVPVIAYGLIQVWSVFYTSGRLLVAAVPVISAMAAFVGSGLLLRGVGDAARYFSNSPGNIKEREEIRSGLVEMLMRITADVDDTKDRLSYDRLIVVGHSLGSVIAYDALQAYWAHVYRELRLPPLDPSGDWKHGAQAFDYPSRRAVVEAVENLLVYPDEQSAENAMPILMAPPKSDSCKYCKAVRSAGESCERLCRRCRIRQLDIWQSAQRDLYGLLRNPSSSASIAAESSDTTSAAKVPPRWIISDFVTLGSPLAHAELLLTPGNSRTGLRFQARKRLLPTSPPADQLGSPSIRFEWVGLNCSESRLHHAAVFGPTSWSNLYFNHDLVGGRLASLFGDGIHDYKLGDLNPRPFDFVRKYPHSSYWAGSRNQDGRVDSIHFLRKLLFTTRPQVWITGEREVLDQIVEYRQKQSHITARAQRPSPVREQSSAESAAEDESLIELRLLNNNEWIWPGGPPWLRRGQAIQMVDYALSLAPRPKVFLPVGEQEAKRC